MWQIEDDVLTSVLQNEKGMELLTSFAEEEKGWAFKTKQDFICSADLEVKRSGLQGLGEISMLLQVIVAELPYFSA